MAIDVYEIVTNRILEELEKGTIPWLKPWISVREGAFNCVSGKSYSFLNQCMLKHSGEYGTFDQWKKLGGHVKAGEKGEIVVFWKKLEPEEKEAEEEPFGLEREIKPHYVLRYYRVFHISQVEGVQPAKRELNEKIGRIEDAEKITKKYLKKQKVTLEETESNEAYYSPSEDKVHMPLLVQFKAAEEYYSTLFHELAHSTGHSSRLNRPALGNVNFGTETYSKEELIAEISSATIMNELGIETAESFRNSTAYIMGWYKILKEDKRMFALAASAAERASKFIFEQAS